MGLTINYDIEFRGSKQELISKLECIRQKCLDLPFEEVGEVEKKEITQEVVDVWKHYQYNPDFPGVEARNEAIARYGLDAWDVACAYDYNFKSNPLRPTSLVNLYLWPGKGCEGSPLQFYKRNSQKYWRCRSFCKTQYAEHFFRCHLVVIQLLDVVKETEGFTVEVKDEGEYWETRDVKILGKEINASTEMLKGIVGVLKSSLPDGVALESSIEASQNYVKID